VNLRDSLNYEPSELKFGTSGLRALVSEMTDLECYINTLGFMEFLKMSYPKISDVYVSGDLRESTPRIIGAVVQAIRDSGLKDSFLGYIPTPVLALHAFSDSAASVMVTGSHIPSDRNGIKYYKPDQELMKSDEKILLESIAEVRDRIYTSKEHSFDLSGMYTTSVPYTTSNIGSLDIFTDRLAPALQSKPLSGMKVGVYEQSAVGRDYLVYLLDLAGAEVLRFARADNFISVDTESVSENVRKTLKNFAEKNEVDAIVTTDGDSDRPLVSDETGEPCSGDVLGLLVASELSATKCVYPVSSNDLLDSYFENQAVEISKTKIGSPYVIEAMDDSNAEDSIAGWEVNGGFLVGENIQFHGKPISPLKTRDAFLPIVIVLSKINKENKSMSKLISSLKPARYTGSGVVDIGSFETMRKILSLVLSEDFKVTQYFTESNGFSEVESIDRTDGIRIRFQNHDVAHVRGSGNAPQLRIYSTANTKDRADMIVDLCIKNDGIFTKLG
jgi:phosphomannomutase